MMEHLNPNSTKKLIKEEAEGQYYKPKLEDIIKNAQEILQGIGEKDELDAWVQDKITIAHHNMDAILGYMKSQDNDDSIDGGKADGMSVEDIAKQDKITPDSIKQQLEKGEDVESEHTDDPEKNKK